MQFWGAHLGDEGISDKLQSSSSVEAGVSHLDYGQWSPFNVLPIVQQCPHYRD